MSSMNAELQKYYEDRLDMMGSKAWADLMDDVQEMLNATDTLTNVTSENLGFKQGEINMMNWILMLKQVSEQAYEDLNAGA